MNIVLLRFLDKSGRLNEVPIDADLYDFLIEKSREYAEKKYGERPGPRYQRANWTGNPNSNNSWRFSGPSAEDPMIELRKLAGVEPGTTHSTQKLLRLAMRRCHPDTGGSHEAWLKLDKLRKKIKL